MSDFLEKQSKESNTSRYQQQLIPKEEGNISRISGVSKGKTVPDSNVKYNSAGGEVNEKDLKPQLEAGKYGKVRVVTETHAGHVILVDETENNERVYILHPNGTYTNIEPSLKTEKTETDLLQLTNGDVKVEISGESVKFVHKNQTVKIYKNETVNINGEKSDSIGGNYNIDVSGNWTINVSGNTDLTSGGPVTVTAPTINLN